MRKDRNNEIIIHVPPARVKGCHRRLSKRIEPTHGGYQPTTFEPNLSIGLACKPCYKFIARVCSIARGTCHVQSIGMKPAPSSFRRFIASNEYSPVPIGPAVRPPEAKVLGQIDRQTHKHRPANFFQRSIRRNLRA